MEMFFLNIGLYCADKTSSQKQVLNFKQKLIAKVLEVIPSKNNNDQQKDENLIINYVNNMGTEIIIIEIKIIIFFLTMILLIKNEKSIKDSKYYMFIILFVFMCLFAYIQKHVENNLTEKKKTGLINCFSLFPNAILSFLTQILQNIIGFFIFIKFELSILNFVSKHITNLVIFSISVAILLAILYFIDNSLLLVVGLFVILIIIIWIVIAVIKIQSIVSINFYKISLKIIILLMFIFNIYLFLLLNDKINTDIMTK